MTDAIVPDDKDWTWVLSRPCPECRYDATAVDVIRTGDLAQAIAERWVAVLEREDVRDRPRPDIWSPLEYGCHVRDVFDLFTTRLQLMLTEDDPLFANWNQDDTALAERYSEQDPQSVAEQMGTAAAANAALFNTVGGDQWQRPGRRSDGAAFTIETFARYFLHDPIHHLHDVGAPLDFGDLGS